MNFIKRAIFTTYVLLLMVCVPQMEKPTFKTRVAELRNGYLTEVVFGDYRRLGFYYENKAGLINLQDTIAFSYLVDSWYPPWKIVMRGDTAEVNYYIPNMKSKFSININTELSKKYLIAFNELPVTEYNAIEKYLKVDFNLKGKLYNRHRYRDSL